jgi:hypothetical protein
VRSLRHADDSTGEQISDEHPDREKEDVAAVYQFAAEAGRNADRITDLERDRRWVF